MTTSFTDGTGAWWSIVITRHDDKDAAEAFRGRALKDVE